MSIRPRIQMAVRPGVGPDLKVDVATFIPSGMHGVSDSTFSEGWRTADLIPTGMHGLGAPASGVTGAIVAKLVSTGVHPERARLLVRRATSKVVKHPSFVPRRLPAPPPAIRTIRPLPAQLRRPVRLSGGMLKGMGAVGDADPAGQSWLDRTTQITNEWKDSTYDKSQVHSEAQIAMQGINALLENRIADLSDTMVQSLYQADTVLDQVQKDTLSASFQSPWAEGVAAGVQQLKSEVQAGVKAVVNAPGAVANALPSPWVMAGAAAGVLVGAKMLHLI